MPRAQLPVHGSGRADWGDVLRLGVAGLGLCMAACSNQEPVDDERTSLRYDREYPFIDYSNDDLDSRAAALAEHLERGSVELDYSAGQGYLSSLLAALDIDPSSQLLVFSKTSLRVGGIEPATPRALYFNDDTYVAFVPSAEHLEIAAMDAKLGPTFFRLPQPLQAAPALERETQRCLRCHDSYSLTGGGVPRFILGSGYTGTTGELVSHEAWILTQPSTPFTSRWGGWYVTGQHGEMRHLGNMVVADPMDLQDLESLRIGNLNDLTDLIDTGPYLTPYSDIVALLVVEHQVHVQNAMTRTSYDVQGILHEQSDADPAERIAAAVEPLVEALFFVGETPLVDSVVSSSDFGRHFEARGPRDAEGRSLRDLQLSERVFRHPLSYLIYSEAFDALPPEVKRQLRVRVAEILDGKAADGFEHLTPSDRSSLRAILAETKPELLNRAF